MLKNFNITIYDKKRAYLMFSCLHPKPSLLFKQDDFTRSIHSLNKYRENGKKDLPAIVGVYLCV